MNKRYLLYVALAMLIAYLLTGLTQVRSGERAVVRRFGRVLEHKPEPGLWIGLPWGMDRVDRVPVDLVRPVEVGYRGDDESGLTPAGQLLTGDHNLVNLQAVIHYRVRPEPDQVEDYLAQLDPADDYAANGIDRLVAAAAETALSEWVASRTVDDVLLHGKAELPRWLIDPHERRLEQRLAAYRLGIQIADVTITQLSPPDNVRVKFEEVTQAQTKIRTQVNEAESYARKTLSEAESAKYKLTQLATAFATEQRLQARADAESFEKRLRQYEEAKKGGDDVLAAIWWEQMGELFKRLQAGGRIDLLDHHLSADGLSITQFPPVPRKK
jgi:membrane protease subunit HflK